MPSSAPAPDPAPVPAPAAAPGADCPPEDDLEWTHGDFMLISSDGVRFMVPSLYLMAASVVVDDQVMSLELVDPDIETASNIRHFLDIVVAGDINLTYPVLELTVAVAKLALMLQKYGCDAQLKHLTLWTRLPDPSSEKTFTLFVLGAILDNVRMCQDALDGPMEDSYSVVATQVMRSQLLSAVEGVPSPLRFDEYGCPSTISPFVPQTYLWAFKIAHQMARVEGERLSTAFSGLVTGATKPNQSQDGDDSPLDVL